jgi:hypothetical protein
MLIAVSIYIRAIIIPANSHSAETSSLNIYPMKTTPANTAKTNSRPYKSNPLLELIVCIAIPAVVLMKFSSDDDLGASTGLVVALAFPLLWGLIELVRFRKFNFIALFGLISVLLTGGIGLLQLDVKWLAVKEAAIPALIGVGVLISTRTPYPLIRTLLYSPTIFEVSRIQYKLDELGTRVEFESRLLNANYWLSATFFFSSMMNYILAKWIVTSPAGSTAFNEELGRMTLLSYPIIAIPSMLMMMAIMYYLWRAIHGMTGLSLEQILVASTTEEKE